MKKWYEELFANYAHKYDKECFVQGTVGECDFIEEELSHDKALKILDISEDTLSSWLNVENMTGNK